MLEILALVDTLEPNLALVKGDLQKIAKIHVSFYKFYIKIASKCEALVLDRKSQEYLESCIDYLENKKLNKKGIQQSRSNCMKMLDSLNDLCVTLNCDKTILVGFRKLIDQATVGDEGKGGGTLDLLKQLKTLLNAPGDTNDNDNDDANGNDGRVSPDSTGSSDPGEASSKKQGGIEPIVQYLLSDSGMDSYYHKYNKDVKNLALTSQMNHVMASASAKNLQENSYAGLDNLLAKMKINVPIWNYHVDRVDTIDSSNVMENMEIFGGNKSVTDAVLYSCPDYLTVGPFDVYVRNKVYVYHCLVNDCNNCMTTSLEFLKLHVKFQHGDSDVDWNCTDCDVVKLHSSCQKSLDGALDHLAKHHSIKSTYTLAKERLLEINQKIIGEDVPDACPQSKPETFSEDDMDLFHCPNPDCGFSTNSMPVAFGHYALTLDQNSVVQCRYCPLVSYSTYELCEHLIKDHGNANYKCGYCPYRSVSKANCVYHQRDVHPGSPSKVFGIEPLPIAEHKYTCRAHNTIKPFVCNDSCNFGTMVERKFNQHILTHPGMTVTCHYCEKFRTADMGDLRDHFIVHGVGEYHCMYCKEAFNFINKVQQHLHVRHPSRYPFIIICQDYDSRSHSLKGMYKKVQKLDLGDESIVVLPLDSDEGVHATNVISQTESILIEDVDHFKMQLKAFMKNKEEPEEMPYAPPFPHIEETLDLTISDDPKERVDIKPRLRVRTVEELINSSQPPVLPEPDRPAESKVVTFYAFVEHTTGPVKGLPMLNPAQIKQEKVLGAADNVESEIDIENHPIPSVQIKKEILETGRQAVQSPQPKSPRKGKQKQTNNSVHVKMEAIESREMDMDSPSPQPLVIDESREDEVAVAALISQQARRSSASDGVMSATSPVEGHISTALPVPGPSGATQDVAAENETALASLRALMNALGTSGSGIALDPSEQGVNVPLLNESSIDNVPVDFHCPVLGNDPDTDTKDFTVDSEGNMIPQPRYTSPTAVDTVIISSDEEDDCDDVRSSPMSSPPPTSPVLVGAQPSLGEADSLPSTSAAPATRGPKLRVLQGPKLLNAGPRQIAQAVLVVDPRTSTTSVGRITHIQKAPAIQTAPVVDVKRYRCKLCSFASEDRQVTYTHLTIAHPNRFSKQIRDAQKTARGAQNTSRDAQKTSPDGQKTASDGQPSGIPPEDRIIRAVSCPYCPDIVYEGIKSFERHHAQHHCDFTEVKCFLVYNPGVKQHLQELFGCVFCGHFCPNEAAVWSHLYSTHSSKVATMKRPLRFLCRVAFKKMVCPLYNCLDEFLDPAEFKAHVNAHSEVIACKKCTYIADSVEEFQNFHSKIEPEDRILHFYYAQSAEERANLLNVQRFSNPLYSLSDVFFKEKYVPPNTTPPTVRKTTARKSTGGAQYNL